MAWSDAARAAAAEARRRRAAGQVWRIRPRSNLVMPPSIKHADFIASGKTEAEWDVYAAKQNLLSKELGQARVIAAWKDKGTTGNSIRNLLRIRGVITPDKLGAALDHADTFVSATQIIGRGMKRSEANKLHKWVSEQMLRNFPARNKRK